MATPKSRKTIGSVTMIDFPQHSIENVPAKVDTGADASSVWASNITERGGRLSFSLFGPQSPLYTGEIIKTKDYRIRSIKNSFGHTEFRYVVRISMVVEGRTIRAQVNLADRSGNKFPILIGRRTLQGRFLVDVSREHRKKAFRILVLRTDKKPNTGAAKKFFAKLEAAHKHLSFTLAEFKDLGFFMDDKEIKVVIMKSGKDIADFDMVYFRSILDNKDLAAACAHYLAHRNVDFMDRAALNYNQSLNKLLQHVILSDRGISMPKSIYLPSASLSGNYALLKSELGLPFILKDIRGKRGKGKFVIENNKSFKEACAEAASSGIDVIAQSFVPHEGHYRVLIFGKQVRLVMHNTHSLATSRRLDKTQPAKSVAVNESVIPGYVREMCLSAAQALQLNIAGVDAVQDEKTGQWYLFEVNDGPQLVTGGSMDEKQEAFADYLLKYLEKNSVV